MMDETEVIRRVLRGDIDAFRLVLERYEKPVVRMVRNMTNDTASCEDIAQEIFLAAYRKLASFDPAISSFSTWLFTIARNKSVNVLKKKKAFSTNKLPAKTDNSSPVDCLARKEYCVRLDRALQSLPARQRRALILAEFEELSYEEIAQIEGTAIGTIKSRINRAKNKLRSVLKGLYGDAV